jgi:hypothetical protein
MNAMIEVQYQRRSHNGEIVRDRLEGRYLPGGSGVLIGGELVGDGVGVVVEFGGDGWPGDGWPVAATR